MTRKNHNKNIHEISSKFNLLQETQITSLIQHKIYMSVRNYIKKTYNNAKKVVVQQLIAQIDKILGLLCSNFCVHDNHNQPQQQSKFTEDND